MQDEYTAVALMDKNLNKNITPQGLAFETALIDEKDSRKSKLLKIDQVKKSSRRMSHELNEFFENKYGYDGKSSKHRDENLVSHRSELKLDQHEVAAKWKTRAGRANVMSKEDLQFMSSGQQVKRYCMYLHHSLIVGMDAFIQYKHD